MLKTKFIPCALIGAFSLLSVAHSQTPAPPAAAPASSDAPVVGVNPYTGNSLTLEQLSRQLDTAKAQTALLEEQLKQTALREDLDILPAKKKAEAAQYGKNNRPVFAATDAPLAVTETVKPVKVAKAAPAVVEAPAPPQIRITSVIGTGMSATVMLEVNGQSVVAHNNETTPYGVVHYENDSTLTVGSQRLYLPSKMLARMAVSDPTVAEKGTDAGVVSPTLFTAGSGASSRAALPPPIPAPPAVIKN